MNPESRKEQVEQIIALIESGESERSACEKVGMNRATFRSAAMRHGAADQYARALAALAEEQVERLECAIQDMRDGVIDAAQARVEIDARKWFASKFLPKKYGERVQQEISGPDGGPIQHDVKLDPGEAYRRLLDG